MPGLVLASCNLGPRIISGANNYPLMAAIIAKPWHRTVSGFCYALFAAAGRGTFFTVGTELYAPYSRTFVGSGHVSSLGFRVSGTVGRHEPGAVFRRAGAGASIGTSASASASASAPGPTNASSVLGTGSHNAISRRWPHVLWGRLGHGLPGKPSAGYRRHAQY